jgi:coenzyme PQQ synthesis protein D (PqqD)
MNDKLTGSAGNSGWKVSPGVRATCNEDGAVLLDIDHGLCYGLNAVGGRIWQVIEAGQGRSSSDDIVETLAQEFAEVPREQLMTDVDNCLSDLESKALVTTHGGTALAKAKRTKS